MTTRAGAPTTYCLFPNVFLIVIEIISSEQIEKTRKRERDREANFRFDLEITHFFDSRGRTIETGGRPHLEGPRPVKQMFKIAATTSVETE